MIDRFRLPSSRSQVRIQTGASTVHGAEMSIWPTPGIPDLIILARGGNTEAMERLMRNLHHRKQVRFPYAIFREDFATMDNMLTAAAIMDTEPNRIEIDDWSEWTLWEKNVWDSIHNARFV